MIGILEQKKDTSSIIPFGNIVSYWNFNSNSNDQVGSNNGSDTDVSYVSGLVSNAASFNGTSSKIRVPDSDDLSFPSTSFSISFWVYLNTTGVNQFFYGKRTLSVAEYQFGYVSGELRFRLFGGTTANLLKFDQAYSLSVSTWYHIVVTYDNANLKLIVDGANVPITQTTSGTFTGSQNTTAPLMISQAYENAVEWFDGLIDEFSIFNTDLSLPQINEIRNKNLAGLGLTE